MGKKIVVWLEDNIESMIRQRNLLEKERAELILCKNLSEFCKETQRLLEQEILPSGFILDVQIVGDIDLRDVGFPAVKTGLGKNVGIQLWKTLFNFDSNEEEEEKYQKFVEDFRKTFCDVPVLFLTVTTELQTIDEYAWLIQQNQDKVECIVKFDKTWESDFQRWINKL